MRSGLYILLLALVLGMVISCTSPRHDSVAGIKTSFVPRAKLSDSELRQIIKLANKCGISEVGEVYSYNIHPSPFYGFGVKSVESIRGREVSFLTLAVDHQRWVKPRGERDVQSIGRFWVRTGSVCTNLLTTFAFHGGTARVHLSPELDLPTADRIVALFDAGRVRYKDPTLKDKLGTIDLSQLIALGRSQDATTFSISFSHGDLCWVSADFKLDGDEVTVIRVTKVVS